MHLLLLALVYYGTSLADPTTKRRENENRFGAKSQTKKGTMQEKKTRANRFRHIRRITDDGSLEIPTRYTTRARPTADPHTTPGGVGWIE